MQTERRSATCLLSSLGTRLSSGEPTTSENWKVMLRSLISVRTLFLAIAVALVSVAGWTALSGTPNLSAHAVQLASDPAPNEQLLEWPRTISIRFSEPLEPSVTSVQVWHTSPAELPVSGPASRVRDPHDAGLGASHR